MIQERENSDKMEQKNNMMTKGWVVCICALICCFLWGSAFPCIKIGYRLFQIDGQDSASQILFAGCRFALAGVLAILIGSVTSKKILIPKVKSLPKIAILSCFQTVTQYIFFYLGMAKASGVSSSIINGSGTFFSILIVTLVLRQEKMTLQKLLGCILGFVGVILVSFAGGENAVGFVWNGEGFIVISALCYAISSVLIKLFGKDENPVVLSGYQFFLGGVIMSICGIALGGHFRVTDAKGIILLIYMAMISAVSYSLWGILLKHNPVSRVTIYGFANPVFGVILSAILLGEGDKINLFCLVSLALVSLGIYLVNVAGKNHPHD